MHSDNSTVYYNLTIAGIIMENRKNGRFLKWFSLVHLLPVKETNDSSLIQVL